MDATRRGSAARPFGYDIYKLCVVCGHVDDLSVHLWSIGSTISASVDVLFSAVPLLTGIRPIVAIVARKRWD